jgi:hypothetical protein
MNDGFSAALEELTRSGDLPEMFSEPFVDFLPVTGASVSTLGDLLGSETISASDRRAARLDELQFDLGEGPCWDALRTARPVAEPALSRLGAERWPAFAAAARAEPVQSIFAFPLIVGPLRLGAVDLYSTEPTALAATESRRALALTEVISRHILHAALSKGPYDDAVANPLSRRLIHQATGVVLAQLGIAADDARLLIQGHAFASGRSMMEIGDEIISGGLVFVRRGNGIEVKS